MTELEKMWAALEAHQPTADKRGYGAKWARMCSKRTETDAYAAADAARAAFAAADAAYAADAARANEFTKQAIAYITKANEDLTQCF